LTNGNGGGGGGGPTLLPMLSNGYHHSQHHHAHHPPQHNLHMQQQFDPNTVSLLHQVNAANATVSPGAAAASANGLLPPQQRTDRLQVCAAFFALFLHSS